MSFRVGAVVGNRVSIIMPTRNRASLLRRALFGVRAQTVRDMEIIVVDDASTDETLAMLASEFPLVEVVRHRFSLGPSAARNSGVAVATGDWVFFHDDDDLMHPSHLADLLSAHLDAPPNSLVVGRSRDRAIRSTGPSAMQSSTSAVFRHCMPCSAWSTPGGPSQAPTSTR
jgi:glycosyltransferase involved in cell wall biosynthesis